MRGQFIQKSLTFFWHLPGNINLVVTVSKPNCTGKTNLIRSVGKRTVISTVGEDNHVTRIGE
jgi:hypothetical protein